MPVHEAVTGTTLRVYRRIYRYGPIRLSSLQKDLGLSSSSVAEYHVQKLLRLGFVRESDDGLVADSIVMENMIRIGRKVIPVWANLALFFGVSLIILLTLFRPMEFDAFTSLWR